MASRVAGYASRSLGYAVGSTTRSSFRSSQSHLRLPFYCRPSFTQRKLGSLGCVQSLLPLHNVVAESHLTSCLNANLADLSVYRATFCRSYQDH